MNRNKKWVNIIKSSRNTYAKIFQLSGTINRQQKRADKLSGKIQLSLSLPDDFFLNYALCFQL